MEKILETKKKANSSDQNTIIIIVMGKKQLSGAQKRKKKKEKEELALEMERLKLGPTKLWTGLVLHHKDICLACDFEIEWDGSVFLFEGE